MKVTEEMKKSVLDFVTSEMEKVHHGKIVIELNQTSNKIDVVTESRERFIKDNENSK